MGRKILEGGVDWIKIFFVLMIYIILPFFQFLLFLADPITAIYGFRTSFMLRTLQSMK